ncbi:MAG: tetratricopeptide repeat protein [Thermoguttaceae bacterium]|nr:tetratricopeptide repeat protein [Thermoguttaceae bacterium]
MFNFPTNRILLVAAITIVIAASGCRVVHRLNMKSLETSQKYFSQADSAMRDGNRDEAEVWARQALQKNPGSDESRILYARTLWDKGDRQGAINVLYPASLRPDASADILLEISQMFLAMSDLTNARYSIGKCVMKYPTNPDIWRLRAQYFEKKGNPEQAWADLHHSLSLDSSQHSVRLELARSYLKNNQPQRALESTHYVLSNAPTDDEPLDAFVIEGEAFYALERYAQAENSFKIVVNRAPSNPDAYFYLASVQQKLGKYNEALATADVGLRLQPDHAGCRDVVDTIRTAQRDQTIR